VHTLCHGLLGGKSLLLSSWELVRKPLLLL
jgi:hypothetical protein